jgi:hypothetical protein
MKRLLALCLVLACSPYPVAQKPSLAAAPTRAPVRRVHHHRHAVPVVAPAATWTCATTKLCGRVP